jgi:hypothetical protein
MGTVVFVNSTGGNAVRFERAKRHATIDETAAKGVAPRRRVGTMSAARPRRRCPVGDFRRLAGDRVV